MSEYQTNLPSRHQDLVRQLVTAHINGEELGAYYDDKVSPLERRRIAAHLAQCFLCRHQYQTLVSDLQGYEQAQAEAAVVLPRPSVSVPARVYEWLATKAQEVWAGIRLPHPAGLGGLASDAPLTFGVAEDGLYGYLVQEETAVRVVCDTTRLELFGAVLTWRVGTESFPAVFYHCDENELRAEAAIPWESRRAAWTQDAALNANCQPLSDLTEADATPELLAKLGQMFSSNHRQQRRAALRVTAKLLAVTTSPETKAALAKLGRTER